MPVEKVFFEDSKGMKLAAWLHTPATKGKFPVLIRVHGYQSSKDGSTGVALATMFEDMVYFRLDFHAHGESEGEEIDALQCVDDVLSAIAYVSKLESVDAARIALTGSSLGGLAVTLAAAWSDKVKVVVPVCPVSNFLPFRKTDIKYQELTKKLGDDIYKETEKIRAPVLIIHGDKDDVVPISDSMQLAQHLKKGILHIVMGADHVFSNEAHFEQMIEQISEFVHTRV